MSFLPLVLTAVGTGLQVYSNIQEAKSQAEQLEYKAGQTAAEKARMESRQRALYAKSGVTFAGSPLEVLADTATQYEMDIRMQRRQAQQVKRSGYLRAGSTLLTSLGSYGTFGMFGGGGSPSTIYGGTGGVNTGYQSTSMGRVPTWSPFNPAGQRVYG